MIGGSVGAGSVGGGSVGGMTVGGTAVVGGATVTVGTIRVRVAVGRETGGVAVAVFVVRAGSRVRCVAVVGRVFVGEGVIVTLGVKVGVAEMRGVGVRVAEAVFVGAVWVVKGPNNESAVNARAVFVFSATTKIFALPSGVLKANQIQSMAPINRRIMTSARRSVLRLATFKALNILSDKAFTVLWCWQGVRNAGVLNQDARKPIT